VLFVAEKYPMVGVRISAVLLVFLRVVLENTVVGDGILMVKSWRNA
jgi:hypothetical protein